MDIKLTKYGVIEGHNLFEIKLVNDNGMEVTVLNYGATLEKVELPDRAGHLENVIMSLNSPLDYSKERNFLGGTIGRVAGRIKNGVWRHGTITNYFPLNDGSNSLHGGNSIDAKVWAFQTNYEKDRIKVKFTIFDADGENGYPGNMIINANYSLDNQNNLSYSIKANTDKLTLFNPTNHTYFRLGGPNSVIDDMKLQVNSDYYIPVDDDTMPASDIEPVKNTEFDFRKAKKIGNVIHSKDHQIEYRNGLDHPFILNGKSPAAILTSEDKHRRMVMTTDAQSLVIFTANTFDHTGAASNLGEHAGITLEAQTAPQLDNKLDPLVLLPSQEFSRNINWHFEY